ncbi:cyclophilin-like fold protein [Sphingomonas sp. LY29]|uniref:cyclophilin-like fold protein n=1 Tax=Sphingomonas sp. LY29 TaxID=3095341 RepID=UPI002D76B2CD|nr:cyclophilin-like fold protein [Sphingomonas sp. LY29]WRP26383.1 cyclophilin-like fold protein [Sphingomonas sp. LY29]
MSNREVVITTEGRKLIARLSDNEAAHALAKMLPLHIQMRDHLRQEKTGELPSPLPQAERQRAFSAGTLGLWGDRDFVIYYRDGNVPAPGIVFLGQVEGDLSQLDNAAGLAISVRHAD